jgi:MFS family permease
MLGVVFFAVLLGTGRTLYSKYGRNIINFMLFGMIGATVCYIVAGAVMNPVAGVIACAVTGLCTAMLWPGTLIYVEEKIPDVGVAIYAFMAAGGDLGASLGPQMVGVVSDTVSVTDFAKDTSLVLGISAEQVGMRVGLLSAAIFPLAGIFVILYMNYQN